MNALNTYPILIRREFWEHRSLWMAPLAVAGVMILFTLLAAMNVPHVEVMQGTQEGGLGKRVNFIVAGQAGVIGIQLFVACILITFYALDSLFAERKDRSILFWKSLPVSDTSTVLTKFLVAILIVPFGVFLVAGATGLVATVILHSRFAELTGQMWTLSGWAQMYGLFFVGLIASVLWYAPVVAYLMLVSSWARRNVLLWAVLPPVVLMLLEGYFLGTNYVSTFLRNRLGTPDGLVVQSDSITGMAQSIDLTRVLAAPGLGLGLVVAGALLFGAIRFRRFRDDT